MAASVEISPMPRGEMAASLEISPAPRGEMAASLEISPAAQRRDGRITGDFACGPEQDQKKKKTQEEDAYVNERWGARIHCPFALVTVLIINLIEIQLGAVSSIISITT